MKSFRLLLLFLLLWKINGLHSQIAISQPELMYFYQGYSSKIEASSKNGVKHIDLWSPDFQFTPVEETEGSYIANIIGNEGPAKIYMINRKKRDTIDIFDVLILKLPDPGLYFGAASTSDLASINETRFFAKYGPEIPLIVNFAVLGGKIRLQSGDEFSFIGNQLKSEIQREIIEQGHGTEITAELQIKGPDGLIRTLKGTWKL